MLKSFEKAFLLCVLQVIIVNFTWTVLNLRELEDFLSRYQFCLKLVVFDRIYKK